MIGALCGNTRTVSGEGGSCFYRAVAYQQCEHEKRRYVDSIEVTRLRREVQNYLRANANRPIPCSRRLLWRHLGNFPRGFAEMPVPQATPYAIGRPLTVHMGSHALRYGRELPGPPIHVRLQDQHYDIVYR